MTRFFLTLALIYLVIHFARRLMQPAPRADLPQREPPDRRIIRGAPRAVVCGECSTQFEPSTDGWTCPRCGK